MSYLLNFTKPLNPREGVQKYKKFTNEPARPLTLNIIFVCVRIQKRKIVFCRGCWESVHEGVVGYARSRQSRLTTFIKEPKQERVEAKPNEELGQPKPNKEQRARITVPNLLIEDLARELKVPITIAEPLVNWVLDYLTRYWSVGFDRLMFDLAAAKDEEVQFSLEVLGIEVKERKITDYGVAKLRTIVSTIIKYLERAGFVKYVREDYTVNLAKN